MADSKRQQNNIRPSVSCFTCQWRERTEWCVLDEGDLGLLDEKKATSRVRSGHFIFHQGDPCSGVFTIMDGVVAIRKTDSQGHTVMVRLRHPGETIGYRDFFHGKIFTTSAQALSESTVCFIDAQSVGTLLERNPALGLGFLESIATDLQVAEEAILQSASLPVRTRLIHLLLALKDRYADVRPDGAMFMKLPLSRQDIADILGARPETIARIIHSLENDQVAYFSGRMVVMPDLDLLLDEIEKPHAI